MSNGLIELKSFDTDWVNDAWLGLGNTSNLILSNPYKDTTPESLGLDTVRLMSNPEYFSYACKVLLNINLLPVQALILDELWNKTFPMYIASRGFGKLTKVDELIRIKHGWKTMEDIKVGDKVYGGDGKLTNVIGKTDLQKNVHMYKITLRDGRNITVCEDHSWKVWDKNQNKKKQNVVWSVKTTKDMFEKYFYVRKDSKSKIPGKLTKEYLYALPINKALVDEEEKELPIHPYIVGVLLGDGCLKQKTISITGGDTELFERVKQLLPDKYTLTISKDKRKNNCYCANIVQKHNKHDAFWKLCKQIGIYKHGSHTKFIPDIYQYASYEQKLELLRGLNDSDAYSNKSTIEYYTVSNQLAKDYLNVARSIGLHCRHSVRESWFNGKRYADCNRIAIYTKLPIFSLTRKLKYIDHKISKQGESRYEKVFITNIEYVGKSDGYCIQVDNEDSTYITKDYIVTHNSWLLGVYALLRCILIPGSKVIIVGSAFRQSKIILEYMETIWLNAPILRSLFKGEKCGVRKDVDRWSIFLGNSTAIAIPIGTGDKIRGLRATVIIADEFDAQSKEIYERVISGFAAVTADPVDNVRNLAKDNLLKEVGLQDKRQITEIPKNQSIISGTAGYSFGHFAEYWRRYKAIIESKGNKDKLREIFGGEVDENFDWRNYSIIRIPYELIPEGFMDDDVVLRAKATVHSGVFQNEYGAVFSDDSNGFFKRSLIESCVPTNKNKIELKSGVVKFDAMIKGSPNLKYVYGVDTASERDNFSIIILELREDHTRIVYSWITNRARHIERKKIGFADNEHNFYQYCARKIRNLMKVFPCEVIAMDAQGGGRAVSEALQDPDKLELGEIVILPVINPDKEEDTDVMPGLHILDMIEFSRAQWVSDANHGIKKDFEDKLLIFPMFDPLSLELATASDKIRKDKYEKLNPGKELYIYDTLDDCVMDIEELKDELCTIVHTRTGTGVNSRDRWDTPEVKLQNGKKGRIRKDRYSSLIMANMAARQIHRTAPPIEYQVIGGMSFDIKGPSDGEMYTGPEWFVKGMSDSIVYGVKHKI